MMVPIELHLTSPWAWQSGYLEPLRGNTISHDSERIFSVRPLHVRDLHPHDFCEHRVSRSPHVRVVSNETRAILVEPQQLKAGRCGGKHTMPPGGPRAKDKAHLPRLHQRISERFRAVAFPLAQNRGAAKILQINYYVARARDDYVRILGKRVQ